MTSVSEVERYEVVVRTVHDQVVVEVRRPYPSQPKLGLQLSEVEDVDYIVGIGIASLLCAKLLGCLPSADYHIRPIGRRRGRKMPTTLYPRVVYTIRQDGCNREVAA